MLQATSEYGDLGIVALPAVTISTLRRLENECNFSIVDFVSSTFVRNYSLFAFKNTAKIEKHQKQRQSDTQMCGPL